ncbi:hypothetical protein IMX26_09845 [Clostridium sp. 'deep sea']|uniref:hypothetical protein n=1 Tax=Clostridium sp. 'deep sea' TaxID=2779445 RepID=UPI0018966E7A|nr:hypothetical protein [Clostridium sp. 'deep sea']QOR33804.1 hypothetical protein IMX26_09845 [Clostridium sp. 'deep sea']
MPKKFIKNYYMLCDLTLKDKGKHFVIPIPLFMLDGVFDCWWLIKPFMKYIPNKNMHKWTLKWSNSWDFDIQQVANISIQSVRKIWNAFRRCGRLDLVDIETNEVKVKLKLF